MVRQLLHELEVFRVDQALAATWIEEEMGCTIEGVAVESDLDRCQLHNFRWQGLQSYIDIMVCSSRRCEFLDNRLSSLLNPLDD